MNQVLRQVNHNIPQVQNEINSCNSSSTNSNMPRTNHNNEDNRQTDNNNLVITLNDDSLDDVILLDHDTFAEDNRNNNPIIINDNVEIINLDATFDASASSNSHTIQGNNISNNSNENPEPERSTSAVIVDVTESNANETKYSGPTCKVLNCDAEFTSEGGLGQHMNLFQHSPCNPLLLARDCKLAPAPVCYMCPECDRQFETSDTCRNHMRSANHLQFYPPLAIAAYMCPQCLYVFPSKRICAEHIDEKQHHDTCYPFAEDQRAQSQQPVPVAEELIQDLKSKAAKVPFSISCLECLMELPDAAKLRQHMQETNNQHPISVFSNTNLVDIFASYLAGFTCDTCCRLFSGQLKEAAKHQCANGILGTIIENNVQSFKQFIKCCAFTVIKSVDVELNRPGTSYQHSFPSSHFKRPARGVDYTEHTQFIEQGASQRPAKKPREFSRSPEKNRKSPPESSSIRDGACSNSAGRKDNVLSSASSSSSSLSGASVRSTVSECDVVHIPNKMSESSRDRMWNKGGAQQTVKPLEVPGRRDRSRSPLEPLSLSPISDENLQRMRNIIFLDLDNYACFFQRLPRPLPELNFIWGFFGGTRVWTEPRRCYVFDQMKRRGQFFLNEKCGSTKDATDFAIVLTVGKLHERLPHGIAFTILSGDRGFCEVERQIDKMNTERKAVVINPHLAQRFSQDLMYTMVTSVTDK